MLTGKQQQVLEFIREYIDDNRYPPTVREIGIALGIKSTSTVQACLNALEDAGAISRVRESSRSIRVIY